MQAQTREPTGKVVSTWLCANDAEAIRELAQERDRSIAAEVRRALREYLRAGGTSDRP